MKDLANLTFGDMYKSIFERKTAIEDLKRFVLDRPVGDFLFDLLSQVIFKEEQLRAVGIVGYGADAYVTGYARAAEGRYVVTTNLAEVLCIVLNFNVADMFEAANKVEYIKSEFSQVLVGDLVFDITRKFLETKV